MAALYHNTEKKLSKKNLIIKYVYIIYNLFILTLFVKTIEFVSLLPKSFQNHCSLEVILKIKTVVQNASLSQVKDFYFEKKIIPDS